MLHILLSLLKTGIQLLVLTIILSPLVIVYISGIYISTAISLWRLIQHDYGNTDENANMKPALDVLYSLAVVQGVVYVYRASFYPARKDIADQLIRYYKFDCLARASVWEYLEDTMSGCEKDPTFARGRNLITYAVDLMESNSPDSFISGVRILDTMSTQQAWYVRSLIQHMIGSSSSSPVLQMLLQALGTTSPWNTETRGRAARIVKHLAGEISLEQFPRGIQHISSLIGTFKEYNDLSLNGMGILGSLATDEKNARIISDSQGLLSKIMAPVTSDLLHNVDHDVWSSMVVGSMQVMRQLVSAPGEAGARMRRDISGNTEVISAMNRILHCENCEDKKELPMRILTRLYMDTQVTRDFIKLLLHKFGDIDRPVMGQVAGEALAMLSSSGARTVMIILQANDDVVSNLSKVLLHVDPTESKKDVDLRSCSRIFAAKIFEHLCIHYIKDDECLDKLKEAMIGVIPKLLSEILPEEATETGTGAGFSPSEADIEGQHGGASQANDRKKSTFTSKYENSTNSKLRVALLSLCLTVCQTFISANPDKGRQFSATYASSLSRKLRVMVERNSEPTPDNLIMLKLTSKMVISMVKHEGSSSYRKQDLQSLMEALLIASKNMVRVDGSISIYSASGDDDGAMTTKPVRSLVSLVKEANELVSKYHKAEELEIVELSTSADREP